MKDIQSLRDVLFANPRISADRKAILFAGRWRSFRELQERTAAVAAALRREGVEPGDRVALLLHNCPEFIESYFAVTGSGAIFVPLNWRLHAAEHAALLADAEPKILIAALAYEPTFARLRAEVPSLRRIVVVDDARNAPDSTRPGSHPEGPCLMRRG